MTDFPNDALCRTGGYDPELWFPLTDEHAHPVRYNAAALDAKAICARCPVRAGCAEFGMDIPFGIFGGLTPEQRRVIRDRRTAQIPARV